MYRFDLLDSYSDSVALITTFRGSSGMVRMFADREDADRQVARVGGGGYDKRGTCLADFLTESFQHELKKIAARADSKYRRKNADSDLERIEQDRGTHGYNRDQKSLYGATAYYIGRRIDRVRLDGACGWESIVRIAEAIGLQVCYIAETKNTYVHEVRGLDKVRERRLRDCFRAIVKASADGFVVATAPDGSVRMTPDTAARLLASHTLQVTDAKTGPALVSPDYLTVADVTRAVERLGVPA